MIRLRNNWRAGYAETCKSGSEGGSEKPGLETDKGAWFLPYKSTVATHIAAGLAIRGAKVLLVDADPQGHATVMLGLEKDSGLYDLLVRPQKFQFKDVMKLVPPEVYEPPSQRAEGQLLVIPSNVETRNIANNISDAFAIRKRFKALASVIDIVIWDTQPRPSLLHGAIYLASDILLYPTTCEFLGFDGLMESLNHREEAHEARAAWELQPLAILGIVPTMYRSATLEHRENLGALRSRYGEVVWDPVPLRTIWAEAAHVQKTVFAFAPDSDASADAWKLVMRAEEGLINVKP